MEEFIFGTLATDQLKLMNHRLGARGLHHAHAISPRNPRAGERITLTAYVGPDLTLDEMACYFTVDGSTPAGARGVASRGEVVRFTPADLVWDTLAWGYRQRWTAVLRAVPEGTRIRYQIGGWAGEGDEVFADWPDVKSSMEDAAAAFFRGESYSVEGSGGDPGRRHTFVLNVDGLGPPAWAKDAIIYHIFVDRFYPGQGRDWLQTSDLNGFCGGTLWGVLEKLDYILELGANCLWLSPVFVSSTHHGYDVTDYEHVETRLGGDAALRALVTACHERGVRVILDIALNHISNEHPIFREAQAHPASRYRDWFTFDDSAIGYRTFFGVSAMPKVNVESPGARQWLIDVGRYWLREFDVDGFRLDVADGPGPDFWSDFWSACKAEKADSLHFGEVVDAPSVQQEYIGRLDGLLDFHLCDAMRRTFAEGKWSGEQLRRFQQRHAQMFPDDFLMLTFVDNHDVDRFMLLAGNNMNALERAAAFQMHLPNIPVIYYGTEVGLSQAKSAREGVGFHVNRVPMDWSQVGDSALRRHYQMLIAERKARTIRR